MTRTLINVVVWAGPLAALYAYAVFPLLMRLAARRRIASAEPPARESVLPMVSVIVPAYNEEQHLAARIQNVLASDYPKDRLDVIVVSDCSTDGTNDIARSFESSGVRVLVQETRRGKSAGLNRAVAASVGELVVFTDANASFPADAIGNLARYFRDPRIGLVTGYTRYTVDRRGDVADATNAYTSIERIIKRGESRWGCCVGADGAIFAMRRSLYRELRSEDINDLVLPLSVIDQGYRCVLAEDAYCSEHAGETLDNEFRRQSRITNRTLRALTRRVHLLNPLRFPVFSFLLLSHKILRFLVPLLLPLSALAAVYIAGTGWARLAVAAAAISVAAVLFRGPLSRLALSIRPMRLLHVFITMNLAMLHGWWKFVRGDMEATWQHGRAVSGR